MFYSLESYVETDSFVITDPSLVELTLDHVLTSSLTTIPELLTFLSPLSSVRFEFLICEFKLIEEIRFLDVAKFDRLSLPPCLYALAYLLVDQALTVALPVELAEPAVCVDSLLVPSLLSGIIIFLITRVLLIINILLLLEYAGTGEQYQVEEVLEGTLHQDVERDS